MLEIVNNEEIDTKSIFFSDEAWFCKKMDSTYSIFCEQGVYQIMMCKIYLSFNQLTSVKNLPPAQLAWSQTRSFRPAGLEVNFHDRMSQMHCNNVIQQKRW